jgi:hypothetical protein
MTRLKLSDITDETPVKLTIEISARLHGELQQYGLVLNGGVQDGAPQPSAIIAPMIERFIAGDREFAKARRSLMKAQ